MRAIREPRDSLFWPLLPESELGTNPYKFGWLQGSRKLLKRKGCLVAEVCNHPNCLVLPFRLELIQFAA